MKTSRFCMVLLIVLSIMAGTPARSQNTEQKTEILNELNNGKIDRVIQMLEGDLSLLETVNPRGSTLLCIAAADGRTELVKYLIKKGASINVANNFGNTPLHYAAWAADPESFRILYEHGAKIDAKNSRKQTPVQYVCMGGSLELFKFCIAKGVDILTTEPDGSTLIHWAAYGGNVEIFKYLELKGVDINSQDASGCTPMFWAATGNKVIIIKYLVEDKKLPTGIQDKSGCTPLYSALHAGSGEAARYLIEKGSLRDETPENRRNLLLVAAERESPDLLQLLIDKGCPVNDMDDSGRTPLMVASGMGNLENVKILIKNGAKTEPALCKRKSCSYSGDVPLHNASWRSPAVVEYLIASGANVNQTNLNGETALHRAVCSDSIRIIEILSKYKADINAANNSGETPLMYAINRQKEKAVEILLNLHVDVSKTDNSGKTALHYSAICGNGKISDLLIANGADASAADKVGHSPAYYARLYGNEILAQRIIKAGGKNEQVPADMTGLVSKKINDNEACIWYLNHSGWAVKTKNHLLIFDYWQPISNTDQPCMDNGHLNPAELVEQNVTFFVSHSHEDHFSREIFDCKNQITNIRYVLGFETAQYTGYTYTEPGKEKSIGDIKFTAISSTDDGQGFLVEVDGVKIFHPGDHAKRTEGTDTLFTKEIDLLSKKYQDVDIVFVPVLGCNFNNKKALAEGNEYIISTLNPGIVLPMHGGVNEKKYREYAAERTNSGKTDLYRCVLHRGDRMVYRKNSRTAEMK